MNDQCSTCLEDAVATATDPLSGETHRQCQNHAEILDLLDDESRKTYRLLNDVRANRPRLVQWDVEK